MRKVGQFEQEKLALRFWEYLKNHEVDSSLEEDDSLSIWTIWVADEDKIDFATEKQIQFAENPDDPIFLSSSPGQTTPKNPSPKKSRFKEINFRDRWKTTRHGPGPVTLSLIITSVGVFLLSAFGKNTQMAPRPLQGGPERSTFGGPFEAASGSAESCISASCTSPTMTSVELEPGSGPAGG